MCSSGLHVKTCQGGYESYLALAHFVREERENVEVAEPLTERMLMVEHVQARRYTPKRHVAAVLRAAARRAAADLAPELPSWQISESRRY